MKVTKEIKPITEHGKKLGYNTLLITTIDWNDTITKKYTYLGNLSEYTYKTTHKKKK